MTPDRLASHLSVNSYGPFTLTDAVRPGAAGAVLPRQGYRVEVFRDPRARLRLPMLSAAVSAERLFDTFLDLLQPLGEVVHVVLESSHGSRADAHADLRRSHIDLPVLASHFCDHEELLLEDGCTGVAVISREGGMEVQFDEHKLLVAYAQDLGPFEAVLRRWGVRRDDAMRLITEGEHLHASDPRHEEQFEQLASRVGVGELAEQLNW